MNRAFALLAEKAKYPATLFALRPLRALLHDIPSQKRSETQRNLAYWADSYDALICYKTVTLLEPCRLEPMKPSHDRCVGERSFR
jgi:hypothetical protein